jgi:hypothetical protein
VTVTELLRLAEGHGGWVSAVLLGLGVLGYATERFTGLAGPATRLVTIWRDRELRKLRREALLRAERRRIEQEEESARFSALRDEVQWLRAEVARLRSHQCGPDTAPMCSSRNPARVPVPRR